MGFLSRKGESSPKTTVDQAVRSAMVTSDIGTAINWAKNNAKSLGYGDISEAKARELAKTWGYIK